MNKELQLAAGLANNHGKEYMKDIEQEANKEHRCTVCKSLIFCGDSFIDTPDQVLYYCISHSLSDKEKELIDHLDLEVGTYCTCEGECW